MVDALDAQRAVIVGHDWGGGVAWTVAHFFPERVDRLIALTRGTVRADGPVHEVMQVDDEWLRTYFSVRTLVAHDAGHSTTAASVAAPSTP